MPPIGSLTATQLPIYFQTATPVHVSHHKQLQCAVSCDVDLACNMWFYVNGDCYWGAFATAAGPGVTEYVTEQSLAYYLIPSRIA